MFRYTSTHQGRCLPVILLFLAIACVITAGLATRYGISWPRRLIWPHPAGIVLHHSASGSNEGGIPVDAALIDRWHQSKGWGQSTGEGQYHIGYHYVILPDGTVERGRPEWMLGAHTRGHNDLLGICLIGNFSSTDNPSGKIKPSQPTKEQLDALQNLLLRLAKRYHLAASQIMGHRDLGHTRCPGDRFPLAQVRARLVKAGIPREPVQHISR